MLFPTSSVLTRVPPRGRSADLFAGLFAGLLAAGLAVLLGGCGAGFAAFDSSGGDSAVVPSLVLGAQNKAPLHSPGALVRIEVRDYPLPETVSRIMVELRAYDGTVDEQRVARVPNPNAVDVFYDTSNITAETERRFGANAVFERDVQATLALLVDGVEVIQPLSITLVRRPTIVFPFTTETLLLSPLGPTVEVRIESISLQFPHNSIPKSSA